MSACVAVDEAGPSSRPIEARAGRAQEALAAGTTGTVVDASLAEAPCPAPLALQDFAIYAAELASLGEFSAVDGGHVGVAATTDVASVSQARLIVQLNALVEDHDVFGKSVRLSKGSRVGDVWTSRLIEQSTLHGAVHPFSLMPELPEVAREATGTTDVTVRAGELRELPPGDYRDVRVSGILRLSGGTYRFRALTTGVATTVKAAQPTRLYIDARLQLGADAYLGPTHDSPLTAKDLIITSPASDLSSTTTAAIRFGDASRIRALLIAPQARIVVQTRATLNGAVIAHDARLQRDVRVIFEDGVAGAPLCEPDDCDDDNPCTSERCCGADCLSEPLSAGTACSDGDVCNGDERCNGAGACEHGPAPAFDDGDPCTVDTCDPASGPVYSPAPDGTPCGDSDPCNGPEACNAAGVCVAPVPENGSPTTGEGGAATGSVRPWLDDQNVCTVDACDPIAGITHAPVVDGSPCDDHDQCTLSDACIAGVCSPGADVECRPLDECHAAGVCDSTTGVCSNPSIADGPLCAGWVAYWPLDDQNGATASEANGNHGVLSNGATFTGASKYGPSAARFDGLDDHISIASPQPALDISSALTISAWARPTQPFASGSSAPAGSVLRRRTGYDLTVWSDGRLEAAISRGPLNPVNAARDHSWTYCTSAPGAVPFDAAFHHVASTVDVAASGTNFFLYVDGNRVASCAAGAAPFSPSGGIGIGSAPEGDNWFFTGTIDEVRLHDRALSATGIAALAAGTCGAPCSIGDDCAGIDDGNACTVDACAPATGVTHAPAPSGSAGLYSTSCATDEFESLSLGTQWEEAFVGQTTYVLTGDAIRLVDAAFSPFLTPGSNAPNENSWVHDLNYDRGNQIAWPLPIGGGDFSVELDYSWQTTDPQMMQAGVGLSGADGRMGVRAGVWDGRTQGSLTLGSRFAQVRTPPGTAWSNQTYFWSDINEGSPTSAIGSGTYRIERVSGVVSIWHDGVLVLRAPHTEALSYVVLFAVRSWDLGTSHPFGLVEVSRLAACVTQRCNDGDACNGVEACDGAGACTPGVPPATDDANSCTSDRCDAQSGVIHTPLADGTTCDDRSSETWNDVCAAGTCTGAINLAPTANAGPDQTTTSRTGIPLAGAVADDGLPFGTLDATWLQMSGPSTAVFADRSSASTMVTVTAPGTYVLRLIASDTVRSTTDDMTLVVQADGPTTCTPPSDLVAWWPADGDFLDRVGTNHGSGEPAGAFAAGHRGQAFAFDTGRPLVSVAHHASLLLPNAFSIELWFNPSVDIRPEDQASPLLFAKGFSNSLGIANASILDGTPWGQLEVRGPTPRAFSTTRYWAANRWYHAVTTFDGGTYRVYVNGRLEGSSSSAYSILGNTDPLHFGGFPGASLNAFRGLLDDLRVYSRALSESEVLSLFTGTEACPSANQAPVVVAGPDQLTRIAQPAQLNGIAADDGLPLPSTVGLTWSQSSGAGPITFANATQASTTATSTTAGWHTLRLDVSDTELTSFDDMRLCVAEPNQRFVDDFENGSIDRIVQWTTGCCGGGAIGESGGLFFTGSGTGLAPGASQHNFFRAPNSYSPLGAGVVARARIRFNGDYQQFGFGVQPLHVSTNPGDLALYFYTGERPRDQPNTVFMQVHRVNDARIWQSLYLAQVPMTWYEFHDVAIEWRASTVRFFIDGQLVGETPIPVGCRQELTIGNARPQLMETDWVEVHSIGEANNAPPLVDVGADRVVTLPASLAIPGVVVDDGRPTEAALALTWSQVSGPGTATFAPSNAANTIASFSAAGTYVLRLVAGDGELSAHDELTVRADPQVATNAAPTVSAGGDLSITLPAVASLTGAASDDGLPAGNTLSTAWSVASGPGAVVFATAGSPVTTATFAAAGTYVLRLSASDGALAATDDVTIVVHPAPIGNQAPIVNAGSDRTATAGTPILITGSYADDGLPAGGAITHAWGLVNPVPTPPLSDDFEQLTLDVLFTAPGIYELALRVNDGELDGYDTVVVNVVPPVNQAPSVSTGADQTLTFPAGASLSASASDDGLPAGSTLAVTWSGPPGVVFANAAAATTTATFSSPGSYVLRATVSDGVLTAFDELTVTVNPGAPNTAPVPSAGPDREILLPQGSTALGGSASDDGLPVGSMLVVSWTRVSGPGSVSFVPANAAATVASFTAAGEYVLRLTASDGELTRSDDVTVMVWAPPGTGTLDVAWTAPEDDAVITSPTVITGSVTGTDLFEWSLEHRLMDASASWVRFAEGNAVVGSGALGTLDPTLLLNGLYEVRLVAVGLSRQVVSITRTLTVEGNQKVGNFTVSFRDLSVPLAGIPIEVIRTYDSRDKRLGDFGVGWTLDIESVRVQKNRVIGQSWSSQVYEGVGPFGIGDAYCIEPGRRRYVTITFADGEVFRFEAHVDAPGGGWQGRAECQLGAEFSEAAVVFTALPGTNATLTRRGGNSVIVSADWPGSADLMASDFGSLFNPDDFVVTLRDGRQLDVATATGLARVTDTNGNVLQILPTGLVHSSGESISFTRDSLGRITTITDPMGHVLRYGYNASRDLVTFTDASAEATQYAYDANHYLLGIQDARGITPIENTYDAAGRLASHTDALGNEITYQHDLVQRRETVCDRLDHCTVHAYDDRGNVLSTTDALGQITRYEYDDRDNQVLECNPLNECTEFGYDTNDDKRTERDHLGNTTSYDYDGRGNVLSVTDPLGRVTTNEYDGAGNLRLTTDALLGTTSYGYDAAGLQTSMTDALNRTSSYAYDIAGNLLEERDALGHVTRYEYDDNGNRAAQITTRTLAGGAVETLTTSFEYDASGRLLRTVHPDGSDTRSEYDDIGQQVASIDALGRRTTRVYDQLGRMTETRYADGMTETTGYDAEGRRISSTDRGGRTTTFAYDELGRLTRTTFPGGAFTSTAYDEAGRTRSTTDETGGTTTYGYDGAGRRISVADPLGAITRFTYDGAGNQLSVIDPLEHTTSYIYDALNRRTRTTYDDGTSDQDVYDALGRRIAKIDQAGVRTEYGYDALGRLTSVLDAAGGLTTYGYDELGNQLSQTDANGHVTRFGYDRMSRRVRRTLPAVAPATAGAFETMSYDVAGNLTAKTDFMGRTIELGYDSNNRLVEKRYPDGRTFGLSYTPSGQRATAVDTRGTTEYQYDNRDRLTAKIEPDGRRLNYGYDAAGRRTALTAFVAGRTLTTTYRYDVAGRLIGVTDPNGDDYGYEYDLAGRRTELTQPNGTVTEYTYDALNRLRTLVTEHAPSGNVIQSYAYTLGPTGIRTRIDEAGGVARSYGYDSLYRLTQETVTGSGALDYAKTFTYDAVGNRRTQVTTGFNAGSVAYAYDERDRLLSENGVAYAWDEAGRMLGKTGDASYEWDFEDRLLRVTTADGTVVEHTYDVDGVRTRTVETLAGGAADVTDYLVDTSGTLSHVVASTNGHGLVTCYIRGGNQLIALLDTDDAKQYHADGLGSVRALTRGDASATDTYAYTAFGEAVGWRGADMQPYRFAGEELSSQTYHLRARELDPTTARLLTSDPVPGRYAVVQELNRYAYATSSPLNSIDPTGLFTITEVVTSTSIQNVLRTREVRFALWASQAKARAEAIVNLSRFAAALAFPKTTATGLLSKLETPLGELELSAGWSSSSGAGIFRAKLAAGGPSATLQCPMSGAAIGPWSSCVWSTGGAWKVQLWEKRPASIEAALKGGVSIPGAVNSNSASGGIAPEAGFELALKVGTLKISKSINFEQWLEVWTGTYEAILLTP